MFTMQSHKVGLGKQAQGDGQSTAEPDLPHELMSGTGRAMMSHLRALGLRPAACGRQGWRLRACEACAKLLQAPGDSAHLYGRDPAALEEAL